MEKKFQSYQIGKKKEISAEQYKQVEMKTSLDQNEHTVKDNKTLNLNIDSKPHHLLKQMIHNFRKIPESLRDKETVEQNLDIANEILILEIKLKDQSNVPDDYEIIPIKRKRSKLIYRRISSLSKEQVSSSPSIINHFSYIIVGNKETKQNLYDPALNSDIKTNEEYVKPLEPNESIMVSVDSTEYVPMFGEFIPMPYHKNKTRIVQIAQKIKLKAEGPPSINLQKFIVFDMPGNVNTCIKYLKGEVVKKKPIVYEIETTNIINKKHFSAGAQINTHVSKATDKLKESCVTNAVTNCEIVPEEVPASKLPVPFFKQKLNMTNNSATSESNDISAYDSLGETRNLVQNNNRLFIDETGKDKHEITNDETIPILNVGMHEIKQHWANNRQIIIEKNDIVQNDNQQTYEKDKKTKCEQKDITENLKEKRNEAQILADICAPLKSDKKTKSLKIKQPPRTAVKSPIIEEKEIDKKTKNVQKEVPEIMKEQYDEGKIWADICARLKSDKDTKSFKTKQSPRTAVKSPIIEEKEIDKKTKSVQKEVPEIMKEQYDEGKIWVDICAPLKSDKDTKSFKTKQSSTTVVKSPIIEEKEIDKKTKSVQKEVPEIMKEQYDEGKIWADIFARLKSDEDTKSFKTKQSPRTADKSPIIEEKEIDKKNKSVQKEVPQIMKEQYDEGKIWADICARLKSEKDTKSFKTKQSPRIAVKSPIIEEKEIDKKTKSVQKEVPQIMKEQYDEGKIWADICARLKSEKDTKSFKTKQSPRTAVKSPIIEEKEIDKKTKSVQKEVPQIMKEQYDEGKIWADICARLKSEKDTKSFKTKQSPRTAVKSPIIEEKEIDKKTKSVQKEVPEVIKEQYDEGKIWADICARLKSEKDTKSFKTKQSPRTAVKSPIIEEKEIDKKTKRVQKEVPEIMKEQYDEGKIWADICARLKSEKDTKSFKTKQSPRTAVKSPIIEEKEIDKKTKSVQKEVPEIMKEQYDEGKIWADICARLKSEKDTKSFKTKQSPRTAVKSPIIEEKEIDKKTKSVQKEVPQIMKEQYDEGKIWADICARLKSDEDTKSFKTKESPRTTVKSPIIEEKKIVKKTKNAHKKIPKFFKEKYEEGKILADVCAPTKSDKDTKSFKTKPSPKTVGKSSIEEKEIAIQTKVDNFVQNECQNKDNIMLNDQMQSANATIDFININLAEILIDNGEELSLDQLPTFDQYMSKLTQASKKNFAEKNIDMLQKGSSGNAAHSHTTSVCADKANKISKPRVKHNLEYSKQMTSLDDANIIVQRKVKKQKNKNKNRKKIVSQNDQDIPRCPVSSKGCKSHINIPGANIKHKYKYEEPKSLLAPLDVLDEETKIKDQKGMLTCKEKQKGEKTKLPSPASSHEITILTEGRIQDTKSYLALSSTSDVITEQPKPRRNNEKSEQIPPSQRTTNKVSKKYSKKAKNTKIVDDVTNNIEENSDDQEVKKQTLSASSDLASELPKIFKLKGKLKSKQRKKALLQIYDELFTSLQNVGKTTQVLSSDITEETNARIQDKYTENEKISESVQSIIPTDNISGDSNFQEAKSKLNVSSSNIVFKQPEIPRKSSKNQDIKSELKFPASSGVINEQANTREQILENEYKTQIFYKNLDDFLMLGALKNLIQNYPTENIEIQSNEQEDKPKQMLFTHSDITIEQSKIPKQKLENKTNICEITPDAFLDSVAKKPKAQIGDNILRKRHPRKTISRQRRILMENRKLENICIEEEVVSKPHLPVIIYEKKRKIEERLNLNKNCPCRSTQSAFKRAHVCNNGRGICFAKSEHISNSELALASAEWMYLLGWGEHYQSESFYKNLIVSDDQSETSAFVKFVEFFFIANGVRPSSIPALRIESCRDNESDDEAKLIKSEEVPQRIIRKK